MRISTKAVPFICFIAASGGLLVAGGRTPAAEPVPSASADARPKDQYLRVARDKDNKPTALEASIVRCAPLERGKPGLTVDLVAAVHVGDKSYYEQLNKEFAGYDVVLYELVAPEGKSIPKGGGSTSLISTVQKGLKDVLHLEFQLEVIDYTGKNMVHADMSPEQFSKSMHDRGESVWTMLLRMMTYAMARQAEQGEKAGQPSEIDVLLALFDKNRSLALKKILAEEFADMEGSLRALEGPQGSTLISERNKVVVESLRKEIAAGKRKIAIFYGAGHMPNLEQHLRDDLGLAPIDTRWLVAWNLKQ
jgi:hypothetical protein